MQEPHVVDLLVPPSGEEMDRAARGEMQPDELHLFELRLALHSHARRRYLRLMRLRRVLAATGGSQLSTTHPGNRSPRFLVRLATLGALSIILLLAFILVPWQWKAQKRAQGGKVAGSPAKGVWSRVTLSVSNLLSAQEADAAERALRALTLVWQKQVEPWENLPAILGKNGEKLDAQNTVFRTYPLGDGRTLALVLRGSQVDGLMLDLSAPERVTVTDHWSLDLWDTAERTAGAREVALAKGYFRFQNMRHLETGNSSQWGVYSPGCHAFLHEAVDIDGDGAAEYPVSLQGVLVSLSADGKVKQSWNTPAGLCGWIYAPGVFADLGRDGKVEAIVPLASAFYWPEHPEKNLRGIAVVSSRGSEVLRLPSYVKMREMSPPGAEPDLLIASDPAGNEGYETTVDYKGKSVALDDSKGFVARVGFDGLKPVLAWIPPVGEFDAPKSSAILFLGSVSAGASQWILVTHHTPTDETGPDGRSERLGTFSQLFEFLPDEERILPRSARSELVGCFNGGPEVVGDGAAPRLLIHRNGSLELVTPGLGRVASAALPRTRTPTNVKSILGLVSLPGEDGAVTVLGWASDKATKLTTYDVRDGTITDVEDAGQSSPILNVIPLDTGKSRSTLLVLSDKPEFWELRSAR